MKNKLSRRQFLRSGTLAVASAAVSLGFLGCSRTLIQKGTRLWTATALRVHADSKSPA